MLIGWFLLFKNLMVMMTLDYEACYHLIMEISSKYPRTGSFSVCKQGTLPTVHVNTWLFSIAVNGMLWIAVNGTVWIAVKGTFWIAVNGTFWIAVNGTFWIAVTGTLWIAVNGTLWIAVNGTFWIAVNEMLWTAVTGMLWIAVNGTFSMGCYLWTPVGALGVTHRQPVWKSM